MTRTRTLLPPVLQVAAIATALLLPTLRPATVLAQAIPHAGAPTGPVVEPRDTDRKPKAPEPPALPGSHTSSDAVAPMTAVDLQPTDALFDAINRGDIAAVRDSIARGADIHGTNILGLTPTELSVDLARNDITFLLLSMRGIDGSQTSGPPGAPPPAAVAARGKGRGRQPAAADLATADAGDAAQSPAAVSPVAPKPGSRAARAAAAQAAAANQPTAGQATGSGDDSFATAAPAPVAGRAAKPVAPPRQYAGDSGGAAIPQMGFLGFGGVTR